MPDITMCTSNGCPVKDSCYRAQATPDELQSYSNLEYTCNENDGFSYYIPFKLDLIKRKGEKK